MLVNADNNLLKPYSPSIEKDGVLDFVGGNAATKLDDIDYDDHYFVSVERSKREFEAIKELLGSNVPTDLGDVVEIGAGTGGFTAGFLHGVNTRSVVLTDISPKMLKACKERLDREGLLDKHRVTFATYSGVEDCFQGNAFDFCVGSFVVHHILDHEVFLRDVFRLLKPGGTAIFLEPGAKFHAALLQATADAIGYLLMKTGFSEQLQRALNWVAENRYNLAHAGQLDLLARREDKHQLDPEQLEEMCTRAGLSLLDSIPYGVADYGKSSLEIWLGQAGVTGEDLKRIVEVTSSFAPRYFGLLAFRDQSPGYAFVIRKQDDCVPSRKEPSKVVLAPPRILEPSIRAHLLISRTRSGMSLSGWIFAPQTIRRIIVEADQSQYPAAVWLPRTDVWAAFSQEATYPALQILCSGVSEVYDHLGLCNVGLTIELEGGYIQKIPPASLADRIELRL